MCPGPGTGSGWQRGFTPAGQSTSPLLSPALRALQDLEVQQIVIRGQNVGEKHSLLWEMGSSERGLGCPSQQGREAAPGCNAPTGNDP